MGPVNWLAVFLAAAVALAVSIVWNERLPRSRQRVQEDPGALGQVMTGLLLLLSAAMLGHNFARIGVEALAAKPWLYFMQTGGVAVAFVIPAIWLTSARLRIEPARRVLDCLFWLVAYLAMGVVFWICG